MLAVRKSPAKRPSSKQTKKVLQREPSRARAESPLRLRAQNLLDRKIEFIPSPSFGQAKAMASLLETPCTGVATKRVSTPAASKPDAGLGGLDSSALLSPHDEALLFRKMNYLKYRASELRADLDADHPRVELMNRIEADLRAAEEIKNQLICANLRLVVSVAKKFVESSNNLHELVSDGNVSLMRAVEKFDVDRGFKFSTYATYAIRRNFFRTIIQARKERQRYLSGDDALLGLTASGQNDQQLTEPQFKQLKAWLAKLLSSLNPREQLIVSLRFGLRGGSEPQTLQDIARDMGVCKERVRQLQSRAMAKLQKVAELSRAEVGELI